MKKRGREIHGPVDLFAFDAEGGIKREAARAKTEDDKGSHQEVERRRLKDSLVIFRQLAKDFVIGCRIGCYHRNNQGNGRDARKETDNQEDAAEKFCAAREICGDFRVRNIQFCEINRSGFNINQFRPARKNKQKPPD